MSGPSPRVVFLRRLAMRVALNGTYRDVAILTILVAGCAMALAQLAAFYPGWPFQARQTPVIGNFALLAWAAIFFVDLTHVMTLARVERALSGNPLLSDVRRLMPYLVPAGASSKGGSLFGFINSILPVTPEEVPDAGMRRAHHLHNRAVVALPMIVLLFGIALVAMVPLTVLVVPGWIGLGFSFLFLVIGRRPRNTV